MLRDKANGIEMETEAKIPSSRYLLCQLQFSLFTKHYPAHLQHGLKSFASSLGVFSKSFHARILNLCPDLLPATTEGGNLCVLAEVCLAQWIYFGWLIDNGFLAGNHVGPGHVVGAHGDFLGGRIDVGNFIDVTCGATAEKRDYPGWGALVTRYQSFGAEDTRGWVDVAGEGVNGDNMSCFVVPRTVFPPVGSRYFVPRVVESAV